MAAATAERTMLVATESWMGVLDGVRFDGKRGQTKVWSDHPAAVKWPQFFAPIEVTDPTPRARVEAATAAPGEKR